MSGLKNIIKDNKYKRWYFNLIIKARCVNRKKNKEFHKHHIIPKSIGGSNKKNNLVYLTFREHFIAHRLLAKFINSPGIQYAIYLMFSNHKYNLKINSRVYQKLLMDYSQYTSENSKKRMKKLVSEGKFTSPFSDPVIHKKTMDSRKHNKTNIFETANPMKNPVLVEKRVAKIRGDNHYSKKSDWNRDKQRTNALSYMWYIKYSAEEWQLVGNLDELLELQKQNNWSLVTIYHLAKTGKTAKQGKMKGIAIRRTNESNKN